MCPLTRACQYWPANFYLGKRLGNKKMLRLSAFTAIGLLTALPAYTQQQIPCLDKAQMYVVLTGRHGEMPVMRGIASENMVFELLINPDTKVWSVLVNTPKDVSCLVWHGTQMQFLEKGRCYRRSKDVKSNRGNKSTSFDQTSYRQICAQGSSHMDTARARSGAPPLPR